MANGYRVLMADPELSYLSKLEIMLLKEYGEQINLSLVTDPAYLDELFKTPQQIDLLVIHESFWKEDYNRQGIKNVFFLQENETRARSEQGFVNIYKYSSVQNVISTINAVLRHMVGEVRQMECKLVMVYSPQGGCGKTTLAIGAARALAQLGNSVLYIDAEGLQTFSGILDAHSWGDHGLIAELAAGRFTRETLERNVIRGEIDYLAPLQYSLLGNGLNDRHYVPLIKTLRESMKYDFIMVDTSSEFNDCKAQMIAMADQLLIPCTQDEQGAAKIEALLRNIDIGDTKKYVLVCNMFRPGAENCLVEKQIWQMISQQIPYQNDMGEIVDLRTLFMELAYSLI